MSDLSMQHRRLVEAIVIVTDKITTGVVVELDRVVFTCTCDASFFLNLFYFLAARFLYFFNLKKQKERNMDRLRCWKQNRGL